MNIQNLIEQYERDLNFLRTQPRDECTQELKTETLGIVQNLKTLQKDMGGWLETHYAHEGDIREAFGLEE